MKKILLAAILIFSLCAFSFGLKFAHDINFGSKGDGDGQFQYVEDFAFDINGNLLVTDATNSNVQVFNPATGKFISKFGTKGTGKNDGTLDKPEGIAVDKSGNIYVMDYNTGFIKKYDKNYKWLKSAGAYGKNDGENMMSEFADVVNGFLYFAEAGNSRVNVYDLELNFKFLFGGMGANPGQMLKPEASKGDSAGNIWVCDLGNNRIQKFSKDGKFLFQFGKKGAGKGEFDKPTGIALDKNDNIYVGEVNNNRVQVFDKNGNFLTMFGTGGAADDQFGNVHGLIVDKRGYVFVADTANNRVSVWKPVM
jgi:DNA-binding beta-propeller fold protein YncE